MSLLTRKFATLVTLLVTLPSCESGLLTLKILSAAVRGGCDLISVSTKHPTPDLLDLRNDPSAALVTWVRTSSSFNLSSLPSFRLPEIMFLIPQNKSEVIQMLESISKILEQDKGKWRSWKPTFFVQWRTSENGNLRAPQPELPKLLKQVKGEFPLNSDVFIFLRNQWRQDVTDVWEIYTLEGKLQIQQMNLTDPQAHTFSNYLGKAVRRQNLRQALIRPIAFKDPDYTYQVNWERMGDGRIELTEGVPTTVLLQTLQHALNFSTKVIAGSGWADQQANGTWTGLAAQLQNDEGDIAINFSTMLSYRVHGFDYLYAMLKVKIKVFFRQPQAATIRDILITPLKGELWLSLVGMWTLFVTSLTFIYVIRRRCDSVESCDTDIAASSFLWVLGTFCQQGWHTFPSSGSLKVVFLAGTGFGLLTYIAFSAALVPILSLETIPIKTLEELGRSKLGILGDSYLPGVESKLKELETYKRGNYLKPKEQLVEIAAAIPDLVSGNSAFITFTDGFLTVFERHNHSLTDYCYNYSSISMGEPGRSAFTVKKGSAYKEIFNHKILMMGERGLTIRNMRNYQTLITPQCKTKKRSHSGKGDTLEIQDVATAYFILGGGTVLSLFQLVIESLLGKVARKTIFKAPYLD